MLGWDRHSTQDGMTRRLAALRGEIEDIQSALGRRTGGLERMASDAHHWISDHTPALPRLGFDAFRHHAPARVPTFAVALAAVAVGVGVGCVLYAVTSRGQRRSTSHAGQDGSRRPASRVSE